MRFRLAAAVVLAAVAPAVLESGPKPTSPRLDLRAAPRIAGATPVEINFVAEIVGGNALDDYHCPEIEWNWDDGNRSVRQSDCAPYEDGTEIERIFSERHLYVRGGVYNVTVRLRRARRSVAQASTTINVVGFGR